MTRLGVWCHRLLGCTFILSLSGCASNSDIEKINTRLNSIDAKIKIVEQGLLDNQNVIKGDLVKLYDESQKEFRRLGVMLNGVKSKTDQFEVEVQGSSIMFYVPGSR